MPLTKLPHCTVRFVMTVSGDLEMENRSCPHQTGLVSIIYRSQCLCDSSRSAAWVVRLFAVRVKHAALFVGVSKL